MVCAFVNLQPMPKVIDGSLDSWGNSWGIACVAVRFVGRGQWCREFQPSAFPSPCLECRLSRLPPYPGLARKAPSFRAGMDSAEAEGLRWVQSGVACCSMYCRIILIGAPPQDAAKYDGDQRAPFQYRRSRSFRSFLSNRLDTPFRLLTRADTATLGGYSTNK